MGDIEVSSFSLFVAISRNAGSLLMKILSLLFVYYSPSPPVLF